MGRMKELSMLIRSKDINNLEIEYKKALDASKEHFYFQGKVLETTYAKHLLDYANKVNSSVRRD
jgi:Fe-S cluster biosynthesis and repair protein YggX